MRRKLIKQGNPEHGSFTITLPADWIRKNSLDAGDEIELEELGSSLTLHSAKNRKASITATLDTRSFKKVGLFWKHLSELYRLGADKIVVRYDNRRLEHEKTNRTVFVRNEIELVVSTLLGMEVEKVTEDVITISKFGEALDNEFDPALRKMFFKIEELIDHVSEALLKMDMDMLRSTWFVDRNINKLYNFCTRILNLKGYHDYRRTIQISAALTQLELLGDNISRIAYTADKYSIKKVRPEIIASLEALKDAVIAYSKYFYDPNEENRSSLYVLREKIYKFEEQSLKFDQKNVMLMQLIRSVFGIIMNMQDSAISLKSHHKEL